MHLDAWLSYRQPSVARMESVLYIRLNRLEQQDRYRIWDKPGNDARNRLPRIDPGRESCSSGLLDCWSGGLGNLVKRD